MQKGTLECECEEKEKLHEFVRCLAVCHLVVVDEDLATHKLTYQASSPDELALIKGAKLCGYTYVNKVIGEVRVQNEWANSKEKHEILVEFPFDSTCKRMSVIYRNLKLANSSCT